jgi:hypothetical protein
MRQTINPYKFTSGHIPTNVLELVVFLEEVIESVPEELRPSIELAYDWEDDYGSTNVTSDLYYIRPPTDKELAFQKASQAVSDKKVQVRELAYLAELKAKYEEGV